MLFEEFNPAGEFDSPDQPIPLEESSEGSTVIVPDSRTTAAVRCRRRNARRDCGSAVICFTREFDSGRVDHAECPIINMSRTGAAVIFDEAVPIGSTGSVAYRSVSGRPVHRVVTVRHCRTEDDGSFELGLRFDRPLQYDEDKPARHGPGREVAPGVRTRKLKLPQAD